MTCEQYGEWLGDEIDGTLDAERRSQLDAHSRECAGCRALLSDLKQIRATAATLDRRTPSPHVWGAIAVKLQDGSSRRRAWPQLAAAAALIVTLGAASWFAWGVRWQHAVDTNPSDLVRSATSELQLAEEHYENAITVLEKLRVQHGNALDPSVAAEIAQSLESLDQAIDDSRAALKADPGSFVAQTSLLEALRMKVALLQETVSLMNATS